MKCPYRMNELHTCHDGKTYIYNEFAECYGKPRLLGGAYFIPQS